jgi:hypothetical protein
MKEAFSLPMFMVVILALYLGKKAGAGLINQALTIKKSDRNYSNFASLTPGLRIVTLSAADSILVREKKIGKYFALAHISKRSA